MKEGAEEEEKLYRENGIKEAGQIAVVLNHFPTHRYLTIKMSVVYHPWLSASDFEAHF